MYLAVEGIDFSGKSTQITALKALYPDAVFTAEPGGSPLGEKLRELVLHRQMHSLARTFLFLADRAEHAAKVLQPNREKLIISDRSLISGIAYAHSDAEEALLITMNKLAAHDILPDIAVLLKIDKETLLTRMALEKTDEIEKQGVDYLLAVQDNMVEVAESLGILLIAIDAARTPQDITNDIKDIIDDHCA